MKAEEILLANSDKGHYSHEAIILSMQEYAKDQIEKDRERVKLNVKTKVLSDYEIIIDLKSIDNTPIILD